MDEEHPHPEPCPDAPWPYVQVRWHDSCATHVWLDEEDTPDTVEIITRGWRIRNTKRQIKLVASYYRIGKSWMFGEIVAIPRSAIIEEREIN